MFSFFACLSALAFLPIARVIARGQIPVIDNVIGGVPSHTARPTLQVASTVAETNTPGKLRVVENSGVCGEFFWSVEPIYVFSPSFFRSILETTQGVYQASGYGDLTTSESIW